MNGVREVLDNALKTTIDLMKTIAAAAHRRKMLGLTAVADAETDDPTATRG